MNQAELKDELDKLTAAITKIGDETRTLLTKIGELEAAIAAGGTTSPAVDDALAAAKAQANIVDELVGDAVPTE